MVDPTKGIGPIQGFSSGKLQSAQNNEKREAQDVKAPRDEVNISEEALNLAQAKEAASQVRSYLEKSGHSLGLDPAFVDQLV